MGTWIDDHNPSPAVRAKLGELNAEWAEIDKRLEAEPTSLLGWGEARQP